MELLGLGIVRFSLRFNKYFVNNLKHGREAPQGQGTQATPPKKEDTHAVSGGSGLADSSRQTKPNPGRGNR
jgi:hypothetical protein